jgi:hypothetical protein
MAHIDKLLLNCQYTLCPRQATCEVYNERNVVVGKYCDKHGPEVLEETNRLEEQARRVMLNKRRNQRG